MPKRWYAAMVHAGRSKFATEQLRRQGFKVFSPLCRVRRIKKGGGVRYVIRDYLPGYVLVQFDAEKDRWQAINGTRGVIRLLCAGERPSRIARGVVELLLRRAGGSALLEDDRLDEIVVEELKAGDLLQVREGGFAGFVGKVNRTVHDRIEIMLTVFGREQRLTLGAESFQKPAAAAA